MFNPKVLFMLVVILLFSPIMNIIVQAEDSIGQKWEVDYKGAPVMEPVQLDNGNLAFGSYEVIKDVYHMDFMTVKPSGETEKEWSLASGSYNTSVNLVESSDGIFYYVWSKEGQNSTLSLYSENGQKKWEIPMEISLDEYGYPEYTYAYVDKRMNLILFRGDWQLKVSMEGQVLSSVNVGSINYFYFDEEGNIYSTVDGKLRKQNSEGQMVWEKGNFSEENYQEVLGLVDDQLYILEYVANGGYVLYVFDESGEKTLTYELESDPIIHTIEENDTYVFLIGDDFYRIHKKSGEVTALESLQEFPENSVVDNYGNVFFSTNRSIVKMDGQGNFEWKIKTPLEGEYYSNVLSDQAGNYYIYEMWGSQLYQYNQDGKLAWSYSLGANSGIADLLINNQEDLIYVNDGENSRIVGLFNLGEATSSPEPIPTPSSSKFKDVTLYKDEIDFLTARGIIKGYDGGFFKPLEKINRLQAVQMILREKGIDAANYEVSDPGFVDLKPGQYGYAEIALAVELEFISGKTNKQGRKYFDPYGTLTRGQMAKILSLAYGLDGNYTGEFVDIPQYSWEREYVNLLAANKITTGYDDGTFRPGTPLARQHFALFMARLLKEDFR